MPTFSSYLENRSISPQSPSPVKSKIAIAILLSFLSLSHFSCSDACLKKYTLTGTVIDASSASLADVEVRWNNFPSTVLTKTTAQGQYSIPYETQSTLEGSILEFYKAGFQVAAASAYTKDEAGSEKCGEITLTRGATLTP
jgi:hypothetical protein